MVAPYSTTGGYPGSPMSPDGVPMTDTTDGASVLVPILVPATGQLATALLNPQSQSALTNVPVLNAVLIELRVITALLHHQLGPSNLDLEQMRADEFFSITPATGVL